MFFGPSARTASAAVTLLSIPPLMPTTAPRRSMVRPTSSRRRVVMRSTAASASGPASFRTFLSNMGCSFFWAAMVLQQGSRVLAKVAAVDG